MKLTARTLFLLLGFFLLLQAPQKVVAQDTIRTMFYNVLHFPDPVPGGRWDTLRKILEYQPVDLLMVCELETQGGADLIQLFSLNVNGANYWERAVFEPGQSPGSTSLHQMLFYDSRKFGLKEQNVIITPVRDVNEYILYLKDPGWPGVTDTTFLDVYVTHLKASQGTTNQQLREMSVDSLLQYLDTRPADRNVLFCGDFNVYTSNEPAYQKITDPNNHIVLEDPINMPGSWNNNSSFSNIHTQSTRTSSVFGDGAFGGMDDRFDFIMLSENIMNGTSDLTYIPGSYAAVGNDGTCFNENLLNCNSGAVPDSIINALYYMSDHLPVYAELHTPLILSEPTVASPTTHFTLSFEQGNLVKDNVALAFTSKEAEQLPLTIVNQLGQVVHQSTVNINAGPTRLQLNVQAYAQGIYFVHVPGIPALKFLKH